METVDLSIVCSLEPFMKRANEQNSQDVDSRQIVPQEYQNILL